MNNSVEQSQLHFRFAALNAYSVSVISMFYKFTKNRVSASPINKLFKVFRLIVLVVLLLHGDVSLNFG